MAKADSKTVTVGETMVTLTLSLEEAKALLAVCAYIGGSMDTARRHTAAINDALVEATGFTHDSMPLVSTPLIKRQWEGIYFNRDVIDSDFV